PDIALFPQPGGLLDLAAEGHVAPISDYLDVDSLQSSLISGFLESATLEDQIYAAPMRMAVKSLVWYPTAAYEEGGWSTEPATLQELYGIAEEIKDSGIAPWADAWNADQSTGWVGTDWLEEFMLRIHGPEVYDQWTSHEIPFNDPRVVEALDHLGELLLTEGNVLGGSQTILNTEFSEASLPLFEDPPRAMLHRQGNFVTGFFPEDVQAELDEAVGVFALPAWEGGFGGVPLLGGGALAALLAPDDDEASQVMARLHYERLGAGWRVAEPPPDLRLLPVRRRDHPQRRRDRLERRGVPLRRLGPDARTGGRRQLLDRDGRVGERGQDLPGGLRRRRGVVAGVT